jgi:hypothetical protein
MIDDAAARAAHPGGVRFTERQLYYEVCRLVRPSALSDAFPHTTPPPISFDAFRLALDAAGPPPGLVTDAPRAPLPLEGREPDLAAYGLPRMLVCQDPEVARMLVANAFHMELSCAVVAEWPPPPPFGAMLERARHPRVYAFHDASAAGLSWAASLRLGVSAPLHDIGLTPAHAMRLRLVASRGARQDADAFSHFSPVERAWLADGWSAEVAALPPARLLRALRRIMLGIVPQTPPTPPRRDAGFLTMP